MEWKDGKYDEDSFLIPKNNFRNVITYSIHLMSKTHLFRASWLFLGVGIGVLLIYRDSALPVYIVLILCFALCITCAPVWSAFNRSRLTRRNRNVIAKAVCKVNPGLKVGKWDKVTFLVNKAFYERGIWYEENVFFDGSESETFFVEEILRPTLDEIPLGADDGEIEKSILEASCGGYMAVVRDYFENCVETELPVLERGFQRLPRDSCRSYFWFNRKRFYSFFTLFLWATIVLVAFVTCKYEPSPLFIVLNIFSAAQIFFTIKRNYAQYPSTKYMNLQTKDKLRFLATVVRVMPGIDVYRWDYIARLVNQDFRSSGKWKGGDQFFFDGQRCMEYFKDFYEKPLQEGKSNPCEMEEMVSRASSCS